MFRWKSRLLLFIKVYSWQSLRSRMLKVLHRDDRLWEVPERWREVRALWNVLLEILLLKIMVENFMVAGNKVEYVTSIIYEEAQTVIRESLELKQTLSHIFRFFYRRSEDSHVVFCCATENDSVHLGTFRVWACTFLYSMYGGLVGCSFDKASFSNSVRYDFVKTWAC